MAASKAVVVMLEAAWFALIIGVGGAVLGFKVELIPILDRSAMNYDVDVTARFGELWVSHPENSAMSDLEMTRDGSVATLRGALGDGEFPLVIDVRGNVTIFEPREQGDRILRRPSGS